MARTRSMTRNRNHDDGASSSRKRPKTCAPWSDLNHDLLDRVMMRLGVVEFVSFSGVCKSWRLLAFSNRDTFMASTRPLSVSIITTDADDKECCLEDFEGRKFKTILPDFTGDECIGLTCGYLVFFMRETRDFWLVNPITRHQLHCPDFPADDNYLPDKAILVFSTSISKWVFVVLFKYSKKIWFCMAGERTWNYVSYHRRIRDIHAFKGKIYTLTSDTPYDLCELRLCGRRPKLNRLKIKQPDFASLSEMVSSGDNFYGIGWNKDYQVRLRELDFGEMKWVNAREKILEEYAFFRSTVNRHVVAVKRESWADDGRKWLYTANMWYIPRECMNVDLIDE